MKQCLVIISALFLLMSFQAIAPAADSITVHNAWVRTAPPNAKVLAAYMSIKNVSDKPVVMLGGSSSRFDKIEMHKAEMIDGMMKMAPQERLIIPAGGSLLFEPGGYHFMLVAPRSALQPGEHVELELLFDNGQKLKVIAPVRPGSEKGHMMKDSRHD